ncbi:hypothetical protein A359_06010 [secondary endosymbiont of Ctenarytaina eucalypti]|uniref:Uncharacterized protein n=1 Tax=secondary endosymbiont of Ctenarytaina eucalypti TaxID=1199245 RepID=J3TFI1_9ENTR|nr:hypothetical protein A359_06010 [secondary endosymbiont of Ctenarytaina eucalypti]
MPFLPDFLSLINAIMLEKERKPSSYRLLYIFNRKTYKNIGCHYYLLSYTSTVHMTTPSARHLLLSYHHLTIRGVITMMINTFLSGLRC